MRKDEIEVIYGTNVFEMVREILEYTDLKSLIGEKDRRIGIKPNLVVARPAAEGATTHPEMVEAVIGYLKSHGFCNITILEGAWVGAQTSAAFRACGYEALAARCGVRLVDTQKDATQKVKCGDMTIEICKSALEVDFMINMPVMKGHCQTQLTCALKNAKGLIPNAEKRRFHTLGLHRPIAHVNMAVPNDYILVDSICGDLDFEEGGNPVYTGCIFAARDPVLCDSYAAQRMGIEPAQVPYIQMAQALGVGTDDLNRAKIVEINQGNAAGLNKAKMPQKAKKLKPFIREEAACSACYASLVRALSRLSRRELARMDTKICVGQGFQGETGDCGIGRCTAGFERTVPGCPPRASDVFVFIQQKMLR